MFKLFFFLFWERFRDVKDFPTQDFKGPIDFYIFWQNTEWPRQLDTKEALLRWVKAGFQITALSKTGRRFGPSLCNWRWECFQHWPSYHTARRERDEPFPPALIPTLFPKQVGLGSQSFDFENYHFLMKKKGCSDNSDPAILASGLRLATPAQPTQGSGLSFKENFSIHQGGEFSLHSSFSWARYSNLAFPSAFPLQNHLHPTKVLPLRLETTLHSHFAAGTGRCIVGNSHVLQHRKSSIYWGLGRSFY